jgi:ubiquinone/menaquinone biosynthesis C-methylase UbiE
MITANSKWINQTGNFDFLAVDSFIGNIMDAQALATALEIGLVDCLIRNGSAPAGSLARQLGADEKGMGLLLDLLRANRVVENSDGIVRLSEAFVQVLPCRDLLELKLKISNLAAHDILDYFSDLICHPREFAKKAGFWQLFSGDGGCFGSGKEARLAAQRWMKITTVLTKYESRACLKYFDFSRHEYMLDIGGNSGEFVLRICREYPHIYATVLDLPLVCEIGSDHVHGETEAGRISFVPGNALTDILPGGFDIVSFKSMLHDWPESEVKQIMTNAARCLTPGGTMLIFERSPLDVGDAALPYSMIPFVHFFQGYRRPDFYAEYLRDLGFRDIKISRIELDMPFHLVTGVRT